MEHGPDRLQILKSADLISCTTICQECGITPPRAFSHPSISTSDNARNIRVAISPALSPQSDCNFSALLRISRHRRKTPMQFSYAKIQEYMHDSWCVCTCTKVCCMHLRLPPLLLIYNPLSLAPKHKLRDNWPLEGGDNSNWFASWPKDDPSKYITSSDIIWLTRLPWHVGSGILCIQGSVQSVSIISCGWSTRVLPIRHILHRLWMANWTLSCIQGV